MRIGLSQLSLPVHLGITPEERSQEQEVLIWVRFDYDTTKAEISDDLSDTFDYQKIYDFVKAFPKDREWNLVEKLYADLKTALQKAFPEVQDLDLSVYKTPWEDASVIFN